MPYSLPEKKREYQRQWLAKKNSNKDGSINLSRGIITWEEIDDINEIRRLKTWEECIDAASKIVFNVKPNRMFLAELAIRACEIKHGGNRRTTSFRPEMGTTVRLFAKSVNLHPKTLHEWIRIKRYILDKIKDKTLPFDFSSASLAMKSCYTEPEKMIEHYNQVRNNPNYRKITLGIRYAFNARGCAEKYKNIMTKNQKDTMRNIAQEILEILKLGK